jgi:S-adenosylmethionine:tRNA ribosyltransferase-isomerase
MITSNWSEKTMKTQDFFFKLPDDLIAQYPPKERGGSRLMVLDRQTRGRSHRMVADLPELLEPGSLLVFNKSRVRKARIYGTSPASEGPAEFLLVKRLDDRSWLVMTRKAGRRRPGRRYCFAGGREGEITGRDGGFLVLAFDEPIDEAWLETYGRIPLPPYIKREVGPLDSERYQTVYAEEPGDAPGKSPGRSAAAPTAGLHFTRELLADLAAAGMETAFITLHVGLGTFLPVRTDRVEDHTMHEESFHIDGETADRIEKAKAEGRRVVAVGTTSVRTLESAWKDGGLKRGEGSTSIFIYPGFRFQVTDALFTNFHTPGSTLLMLTAGFAEAAPGGPGGIGGNSRPGGREFILESYAEAVGEGYRFFSYGDAMLIR